MTTVIVFLVLLAVLAGVAWKRGWLGKKAEDEIKADIAKAEQAIKDKIGGQS